MLTVDPHPLFYPATLSAEFPEPLGASPSPAWLVALLNPTAEAPVQSSDSLRGSVRDLLRHGGYKPTGRGKPASEYLLKASAEGGLTSINLAVDLCNAVSLHSGIPISVVDLDRARAPFRLGLAPADARYVFNASGQEIDLGGLLCLFDEDGPCANGVKDAQRTKTQPTTRKTLSVLWGAHAIAAQVDRAAQWYSALLERAGARVSSNVRG